MAPGKTLPYVFDKPEQIILQVIFFKFNTRNKIAPEQNLLHLFLIYEILCIFYLYFNTSLVIYLVTKLNYY